MWCTHSWQYVCTPGYQLILPAAHLASSDHDWGALRVKVMTKLARIYGDVVARVARDRFALHTKRVFQKQREIE